jgi:nucleoside-diphosphate kinase
MARIEQTLSIIKPDGVEKNIIGDVLSRFESAGLRIAAMKMIQMAPKKAGGFYIVHKERPFYGELMEYMSSGPVVVLVLEGTDAISQNRDIMGARLPGRSGLTTPRASKETSFTAPIPWSPLHSRSHIFSVKRKFTWQ